MKTPRRAHSLKRASATKKQRPVRAWVLRNPEVLELVFQVYEDLTALRPQCALQVESARDVERLFGSVLHEPDQSGLQRWIGISERIKTSWSVFDDLVNTNKLDVARCQAVYRDLMGIKVAWQRMKGPAHSLQLIRQIATGVRQVLIHYAQRHGHQGNVSS